MAAIKLTKKNLFTALGKIISLLDQNDEVILHIDKWWFAWENEMEERPRWASRSRSTSPRWWSGWKDDEEKRTYMGERSSWRGRFEDKKKRFHATGKSTGTNKKWNPGRWYKRGK